MTLVRTPQPQDDIDSLRSQLAGLDAALSHRTAEIIAAKSELEAFRIRYRKEVGLLHEELDDLQRAVAEAELAERSNRTESAETAGSSNASTRRPPADRLPRFTSDAVRRLFRDVAKTIHPDLADDEPARARRHSLMVEANRAYALGDAERLRRILEAWERSPEAVPGSDLEAVRQRLVRRIAEVEEQLELYAADLKELQDSPLWQLKVMVDEASARGKDLMGEMVRRLQRDIMVARNRLEAIQWCP